MIVPDVSFLWFMNIFMILSKERARIFFFCLAVRMKDIWQFMKFIIFSLGRLKFIHEGEW